MPVLLLIRTLWLSLVELLWFHVDRTRLWVEDKIIRTLLLQDQLLPRHVGFIMDGNRRFARKMGFKTLVGHLQGFLALEQILEAALKLGIQSVTVYAFSIDNFRRSSEEIDGLMTLFRQKLHSLSKNSSLIKEYQVGIRVVGDLERLPADVQASINEAMDSTRHHTKAILTICCPYTSRHELYVAREKWRQSSGDPQDFEQYLMTAGTPPLDLLIRTSGEIRLSDFLLYQCMSVGCQIYFINVLWPEVTFWHFLWVLLRFMNHRRFDIGSAKDRKRSKKIE